MSYNVRTFTYNDLSTSRDFMARKGDKYVHIPDGAREGTIAKVVSYKTSQRGYYGHSNPNNTYVSEIELGWDGRKNTITVYPYGVEWLDGYTGETKYVFTRKAKEDREVKVPVDRLGNVIAVNDIVAFVRRGYNVGMYFGFITKISSSGTMYVKNMKLGDDEYTGEFRIFFKNSNDLTVLSEELLSQLTLRRLQTE